MSAELIDKARKTLEQMRKTERESGFASPEDTGPFSLIFTAFDAIKAGIVQQDWNSVAEGYVMLEQVTSSKFGKTQYAEEIKKYQQGL